MSDKGAEALQKLVKTFENMTIKEYRELFDSEEGRYEISNSVDDKQIECSSCGSKFAENDVDLFEETSVWPTMGGGRAEEVVIAKSCPACGFTYQINKKRKMI